MRLEEYWGVGPKTRERLEAELGTERAVEAIETGAVRALVSAGLSRGRATRILRRANGGEGMSVLATRDTRAVYKELLDVASDYAVTEDAADRIRVLTPLMERDRATERLDAVMDAAESWGRLDAETRERVLSAFAEFAEDERIGDDEAAVRTVLALREAGLSDGGSASSEGRSPSDRSSGQSPREDEASGDSSDPLSDGAFSRVADIDGDDLRAAASALADLDGGDVARGVDDELDALRDSLESVEALSADSLDAMEEIREEARAGAEFGEVVVDYVASETEAGFQRVRDATPDDAVDAADFVNATLRDLTDDLRETVEERERSVARRLRGRIAETQSAIDAAKAAVSDLSFHLSLARFAHDFDLTRPAFTENGFAVRNARNVSIEASGEAVQPITYAVGGHDLSSESASDADPTPPDGDRVSVLTGANSGGKTTLLETMCQVALLAQMGLPVPAEHAEVSISEDIVFHRRHASFNAGVLESTLRSIVPPLTDGANTLMLVDEFEAITEPGSAADLLHGLVRLTVDRGALGVFVTHLADDLKPLPEKARKDGIFAEGLDDDLELEVDYQPRFGTVGKSTPEFIVSRLLAGADDRTERAGFETLARAVGEEAVQRTLDDWSPEASTAERSAASETNASGSGDDD
ncbi:DNA mismatch repair protein [Halorussus sp. MSC15.2]|uniref:MutS-related protein n=1 Tax=Halorussus sp. MSC15.2 TaxID=2283638 RepID=UPI0013D179F2|nr:DNA mismatch repair protein [Halorussus sp. MSC15.2]NEU57997.1 DNA mismatch repair protein [Halorussus sp. MSC15.2]